MGTASQELFMCKCMKRNGMEREIVNDYLYTLMYVSPNRISWSKSKFAARETPIFIMTLYVRIYIISSQGKVPGMRRERERERESLFYM